SHYRVPVSVSNTIWPSLCVDSVYSGSRLTCLALSQAETAEPDRVKNHAVWLLASVCGADTTCDSTRGEPQRDDCVWRSQRYCGS
ncbi:hypothetical protein GOODEAATRI_018934, partial [Goodea atripinnis]